MNTTSAQDMTVPELQELLGRNASVRILDIRGEEAHREWRIPGSEAVSPPPTDADAVDESLDCGGLREEDHLVVVCARGRSSRRVAAALRERCGVEARSLEGGMAAWSFAWNVAPVSEPGDATTVLQLRRTGKGCLSYLIASEGEALVVDPSLETDVYLGEARDRGWSIAGVLETHIHADHVSRARRLAEAAGAPLYLPEQGRTEFPHRALADGDAVPVGATRLTAVHTPGHTGESHSYLLEDRYLFTGDTLFLNAVGRPDLEARGDEEQVRRQARRLYGSLSRLFDLDCDPLVLPAHTAEPVPFDGRPVAAPLAGVRERIEELGLGEEDFVARLARNTPPTPPNYERIVGLNESGEWPADALLDLEAGANRCAAG